MCSVYPELLLIHRTSGPGKYIAKWASVDDVKNSVDAQSNTFVNFSSIPDLIIGNSFGSSYMQASICTVSDRPIICTPACVLQAFVHSTHASMGFPDNCPQHKVKKEFTVLHGNKFWIFKWKYTAPLIYCSLIRYFRYNAIFSWIPNYFQKISLGLGRHEKLIYFRLYHCILTKIFSLVKKN